MVTTSTNCAVCGVELQGEFICPVCRYRKPEPADGPPLDFAAAARFIPPGFTESQAADFVANGFLPPLWIGYVIAVLLGISEYFLPEGTMLWEFPHPEPGPFEAGFMIGLFFWAYCVYKMHELPNVMLKSMYPISAGRAAGYHFIPLYGFYWLFRWTELYAEFLNARARRHLLSGGWLGLWLFAGFLLRLLDGALSLLVVFGALSYLSSKIRKAAPEL